jgi:hypothetical protein
MSFQKPHTVKVNNHSLFVVLCTRVSVNCRARVRYGRVVFRNSILRDDAVQNRDDAVQNMVRGGS